MKNLNDMANDLTLRETVIQSIIILQEYSDNTLADDISKNMENNAELKEFMYSISVNGAKYTYSLTNPPLRIADMFS